MRHSVVRVGLIAALATFVTIGLPAKVGAVPFTVEALLTGDFRAENPDNLIVNVTITGDTTSNVTHWSLDINSPLHPNATLGTFAFNLANVSFSSVSFSNFNPSSWSITSGTNVPGSGGADFIFETNDPAGSSNNVTNTRLLTFDATLATGNWSDTMFTDAPLATGGGIPAPGAQLGAHLRSLSTAGCNGCSDSGFASGNYSRVPEPGSLSLLAIGLAFAGSAVRRRKQ